MSLRRDIMSGMEEVERYKRALRILADERQKSLEEHGAIDTAAGSEYFGYIIKEESGYSVDIWSWGVHHGKIYGVSVEEVRQKAHETYDMPLYARAG